MYIVRFANYFTAPLGNTAEQPCPSFLVYTINGQGKGKKHHLLDNSKDLPISNDNLSDWPKKHTVFQI